MGAAKPARKRRTQVTLEGEPVAEKPKPKKPPTKKGAPPPEALRRGSVYAMVCASGSPRPDPRYPSRVTLLTETPPPFNDVVWYRISWLPGSPLPRGPHGSTATVYVGYREGAAPEDTIRVHFSMPIRWSTAPATPTPIPDGLGGTHWMWFQPNCIVRWTDATASAVEALYFCIVNVNFETDYGPPRWHPWVDGAPVMERLFGKSRYRALPPLHPEAAPAIAASRGPEYIPQRTPAWFCIRSRGGSGLTLTFNTMGENGEKEDTGGLSNVPMRLGTTGEDVVMAKVLTARPSLSFAEVGWVQHPGMPDARGSSPDGLLTDTNCTIGDVPVNILSNLVAAGIDPTSIDWTAGCAEIKCSRWSDGFSMYYIAQMYNHMVCTGRWWCDLFKHCLNRRTVTVWRVWRDPAWEAVFESVCGDTRVLAAKGGYVPEILARRDVADLLAKWQEYTDIMNMPESVAYVVHPEGAVGNAEAIVKADRVKWFTDMWDLPPAALGGRFPPFAPEHGENYSDPRLTHVWELMSAGGPLRDLDTVRGWAERYQPLPHRTWEGTPEDLAVVQRGVDTILGVCDDLVARVGKLRAILAGGGGG